MFWAVETAVDWMECERKRMQGWCHAIHGNLGSWPDTEVDTSSPVNKQRIKLHEALPLGTTGRSLKSVRVKDLI